MAENGDLSERELEILKLVATGASNKEIARKLYISTNTVKVHLRNIFAKIGVASRTEAAMYAVQAGVVGVLPNGEMESLELGVEEGVYTHIESTWRVRGKSFYLISGLIVLILLLGMIVGYALIQSAAGNSNQILEPLNSSSWKERAHMELGRAGFAATTYEDRIYVIGGESSNGVIDTLECYNPVIDRWEFLLDKPTAVSDINAVVIGGKIFVPGGKLSSGIPTNIMEIYNPNSDSWYSGTVLPRPISGYALASFEGRMYLIGGWDGERYLDEILEYNPIINQWAEVEKLSTARAYAGSAVIGNKIYIFGGYDGKKALSSGEIFSPDVSGGELEIWDMGFPTFGARYGMGVAEIADIVYVIGGEGDIGEEQDALAYFHQASEWRSIQAPTQDMGINMRLLSLGNNLYLLGGKLTGLFSNRNFSYQAIYTISVPLIIK